MFIKALWVPSNFGMLFIVKLNKGCKPSPCLLLEVTDTPICNCQGNHLPAYKGCISRKQIVQDFHHKMELDTRKPKTPHPSTTYIARSPVDADFSTTDCWLSAPVRFLLTPLKDSVSKNKTTIGAQQRNDEPNTVTVLVTTTLDHMQSLWQTMHAVKKLIRCLPKELYNKAEEGTAQQIANSDQVSQSVLDVAIYTQNLKQDTPNQTKQQRTGSRSPIRRQTRIRTTG